MTTGNFFEKSMIFEQFYIKQLYRVIIKYYLNLVP